jgi:hypothetical protein
MIAIQNSTGSQNFTNPLNFITANENRIHGSGAIRM